MFSSPCSRTSRTCLSLHFSSLHLVLSCLLVRSGFILCYPFEMGLGLMPACCCLILEEEVSPHSSLHVLPGSLHLSLSSPRLSSSSLSDSRSALAACAVLSLAIRRTSFLSSRLRPVAARPSSCDLTTRTQAARPYRQFMHYSLITAAVPVR